jgi:hypothetical protein
MVSAATVEALRSLIDAMLRSFSVDFARQTQTPPFPLTGMAVPVE